MTPYQTDIEEQSAECRENWFKDHVAKFIAGGHGDQNKIMKEAKQFGIKTNQTVIIYE